MAVAEPPRGGAERSGAGWPQNGGGAGCGCGGGAGRAAAGTGRHRAAWGWPRSLLLLLSLGGCGAVEASGGQDGSSPAAGPQRAARAGPPPARPLRCLPQGEGARLGAARHAARPPLRLLTLSFLRSAPTSSWPSSRPEETGARAKRWWWWWTRSTRSACCSAAPWPAASSASMCAAPRDRRRPASGSSWGLVCCWGFCASSGAAPSPLSWLWRPGVGPSPATLPAGHHAVTGLGTSRNQSSVCGASLRQSLVLLTGTGGSGRWAMPQGEAHVLG